MGGEALVGGQLGLAHRLAQAGEHAVGVGGHDHLGAVGRRVHVRRGHPRQHAARARTDHTAELVVGHRRLHERGDRLVDGDVDLLALAGGPRPHERREGPRHREHRRERVAQADAGPRRGPVGAARRVADAAHGLADAAEPGLAGQRTGLAEPADVDEDELRVPGGQRLVPEAPALERAGPEVLEDDVAVLREPGRHVAALRLAEVEDDRALVAADRGPPEAVAVAGDAPAAHRVALAGRLDLDDVGSVVAEELPGERAGDEAAQLEDADARQGAGTGDGVGHQPSSEIDRPRFSGT